jgi:hypothetical protein
VPAPWDVPLQGIATERTFHAAQDRRHA